MNAKQLTIFLLAGIITGLISCKEYHQTHEKTKPPQVQPLAADDHFRSYTITDDETPSLPYYENFNTMDTNVWTFESVESFPDYYDHDPRFAISEQYSRASGKSLMCKVKAHDHAAMNYFESTGNANCRDRTETSIFPYQPAYTGVYYAWSILIPDDGTFQDQLSGYNDDWLWNDTCNFMPNSSHPCQPLPPNIKCSGKTYQHITQWHKNIKDENGSTIEYDSCGGQPPIYVAYKPCDTVPESVKERSLVVSYGLYRPSNAACGTKQNLVFPGILKKGEWIDLITYIYWAPDTTGYMDIWINGIQYAWDPSINPKSKNGLCNSWGGNSRIMVPFDPGNSQLEPTVRGANMYKDVHGNPQSNYFKMGQYRGQVTYTQTGYVDEFSMAGSCDQLTLPYPFNCPQAAE